MKKVFFLCFILLMLTGCSIEYNLNFIDNKLIEDIKVKLDGTDYTVDKIDNLKTFELLAISKGLEQKEYEKSFEDLNGEFIAKYHYEFSINDFHKNNILNRCYDSFALTTIEDYYILSTGKNFTCLAFDYQIVSDYNINIKTNHKVIEHNADEVKDGVYSWKIYNTGQQVETVKPIMIKFSKELQEEVETNDTIIGVITLLIIAIVGIIAVFIAYQKNKKNNKI